MSGHGHHEADADHAGHDETTSDDFPADEPRSPGWLPLLGGALFLAGIFAFIVLGSDDAPVDATAAPTVAAAPAPKPTTRPAPAIRPGAAMPTNHEQFVQRPGQ